MKKVTVSQLVAIKQLFSNSETISEEPQAIYIGILQQHSVTYTNEGMLTLKNLNNQQQIIRYPLKLPNLKIKRIVKLTNLLGIICESSKQFIVFDIIEKKINTFDLHLAEINDLIVFQRWFVTASKDLTIRLWQVPSMEGNYFQKSQKLVKYPVALKGHKGSVVTLSYYGNVLLSGSQDKSMICWIDKQIWLKHEFLQPVLKIIQCPLSQQIITITANNMAHFLPIKSLIKKKPQIRGTLNLGQLSSPINISQIDQSFVVVKCAKSLKFIQVNLMKDIHQISMQKQKGNSLIVNVECRGRCVFYGEIGVGVRLAKI